MSPAITVLNASLRSVIYNLIFSINSDIVLNVFYFLYENSEQVHIYIKLKVDFPNILPQNPLESNLKVIINFFNVYQVNFSDQCIKELDKIDRLEQMHIVEAISTLTKDKLDNPSGSLSKFNRDGKIFYRLKINDLRIYFEANLDSIIAHYILPQHSFTDFVFRCKLPVSEEQMIEQHQSFWKYLDSFKK